MGYAQFEHKHPFGREGETAMALDENGSQLEPLKRNAKGKLLPGQRSLNPSGLDRQKQRMLNQLNQLTPRAIAKLSTLIDSDSDQVSLAAVKEVLDRNLGKVKASIDLKVEASMSEMHLQSLMELAQRAERARAERMIDVTPVPASSPTASAMPDLIEAIVHSDDSA